MLTKEKILTIAKKHRRVTTKAIANAFSVSRQYANLLISELVTEKKLIRFGRTKSSFYVLPGYAAKYRKSELSRYVKLFVNEHLEEHKILEDVEKKLPNYAQLPENVRSIFTYAFTEILNNAIEHSCSKRIKIDVLIKGNIISFIVNDFGIGIFNSIKQKKHLSTELESIQELLKGKTTTLPHAHSGEGIFFTSRSADYFMIDSYGYGLIFDNMLPDVFVEKIKQRKKGTKVIFKISTKTQRHLLDVFNKYTNIDDENDYGFDKTEILVKLYIMGGVHISRSEARRILSGLEKFRVIVFDYNKVPMIGQAFADEIYRVFQSKYPHIKIEEINMNEAVRFMITRAKN